MEVVTHTTLQELLVGRENQEESRTNYSQTDPWKNNQQN
jgi:hypothetical protein